MFSFTFLCKFSCICNFAIFVQIFMKFAPKCRTNKLWMIYTILGSFHTFFNWERADTRPQIRPRKIPVYEDHGITVGPTELLSLSEYIPGMGQRYLTLGRSTKALKSLHIPTVLHQSSLLSYTRYGGGWRLKFKPLVPLDTSHCLQEAFWACAIILYTGPHRAVGTVSGCRCKSDCRSRAREFDPGPVPYFRRD